MIHRADVLGRITADLKTQAPDHIAVSKCRIASIDPNHAMILPHDAEHARRMGWMCDRVVEAGGTGSPISSARPRRRVPPSAKPSRFGSTVSAQPVQRRGDLLDHSMLKCAHTEQ